MPANLPPQYYELEREYNAEKDPREKLRMAEELLRIMPKHKGTDHLQAEMKRKISRHRKTIEGGGTKSAGARQATAQDHIDKEGAGQVILIGPPNAGKSSLVDALTAAKPLVADYPYATREPQAGMMTFETVQIQLIDTPPISPEAYENYLSGLIRNADLVTLVCDLAADTMTADVQYVLGKMEEKRIVLSPGREAEADDPRLKICPTVICGHKVHDDETGERQEELREMFPEFPMVMTSIIDDDTMDAFRRTMFDGLSIIRVYTKNPGKEPDFADPIILPHESTVEDAAMALHKDFAQKLKHAKIWGEGKHDGQRVNGKFSVQDQDIIEFHM